MKYVVCALTALLIAGCADTKVIASGPMSVAIESMPRNRQEAMNMAESECQKHGAHARFKYDDDKVPMRSFYDCAK